MTDKQPAPGTITMLPAGAQGVVTPAKRKRTGRPSSYTPEIAEQMCARMSEGESLSAILKAPGMPSWPTVYRWTEDIPEFREKYTRARNAQAQRWVDQIVEISDDDSRDYTERDGVPVVNGEAIARSRLRVDTRKWIACKVLPKLYGDKLDVNHGGKVTLESLVTSALSDPPKE